MNRRVTALIPVGCAIVALFWPLYYIDRVDGQDWSQFDSFSFLVRSIIQSYGRFPLHDPWTLGGLDLLANPQTRVFSPFVVLDIVCHPHVANVLSLAICATFGSFGMSQLLRRLGRTPAMSWAGALMFVGSSWFMLHFEVGHVAFGTFQLMPWVFLCFMRIDEPRFQLGLTALLAFFVVSGGIYTFIFSIHIGIGLACIGHVPLKRLAATVRTRPWFAPALGVILVLLISAKLVPTLMQVGVAEMRAEHFTFLPYDLFFAFFDPRQKLEAPLATLPWEMHELGCYLGWSSLAVIVYGGSRRDVRTSQWKWLAFAAFFVWMGTDWLWPVNPWFIHTKIPLVRNAHVQTRVFLFAYMAWIIVVTDVLERLPQRIKSALVVVVVAEILSVSSLHWFNHFSDERGDEYRFNLFRGLITTHEWKPTLRECWRPGIYRMGGNGCYETYSAIIPPRGATYEGAPDYRGEIFVESGDGAAYLTDVSPGIISFRYDGSAAATIAVNQNTIFGWEVAAGDARVRDENLRVTVDVPHSGDVTLRYHPRYWPFILYAYVLGLLGFATLAVWTRES